MAKKILKTLGGDEYDFLLIGIVSQQREYRLCHFLNQCLAVTLARKNDFEIMKPQNRQTLSFALFCCEPEDREQYYLFANKTVGGYLLPDLKNIDYFLMVKEYHNRVTAEDLLREVKGIPLVLGAYILQPERLRARENLVF